ncbi:MAG: DNA-directed RNA polymerase subunit omega [Schwartzia sp.]|nr:DNA-directed RNA polymerase subunit omega [Schwartzia sp. (in: firmicutes)]
MDIVHPPMSVLLEKVDSRYTLVVLAAKRARQILDGAEVKVKAQTTKNVTKALAEVAESKILYERNRTRLK